MNPARRGQSSGDENRRGDDYEAGGYHKPRAPTHGSARATKRAESKKGGALSL
jgi:hypothetical protein